MIWFCVTTVILAAIGVFALGFAYGRAEFRILTDSVDRARSMGNRF